MINLRIGKFDITKTIVETFEHNVGNNWREGFFLISNVNELF